MFSKNQKSHEGYAQLTQYNLNETTDPPFVIGIPVFFQPEQQNHIQQPNVQQYYQQNQMYQVQPPAPAYPQMQQYIPQQVPSYPQIPQEQVKTPQPETFITHAVQRTDTLLGLSIQYGVSEYRIKQANDLQNDEIYYRKTLIIPNPNANLESNIVIDPEQAKQDQLCFFFKDKVLTGKDKNNRLARIYLEAADWDINQAERDYKEDLASEAKKPKQGQGVQQSISSFFKSQKLKLN